MSNVYGYYEYFLYNFVYNVNIASFVNNGCDSMLISESVI